MYARHRVGVVIPAYREECNVGESIARIPGYVDRIYVLNTGKIGFLNEFFLLMAKDPRILHIRHSGPNGKGGSAATVAAAVYPYVTDDGIDITAFEAKDCALDAKELPFLLDPIVWKMADFTHGRMYSTPSVPRITMDCMNRAVVVSQMTLSAGFPELFGAVFGNIAVSQKGLEVLNNRAGRPAGARVLAVIPRDRGTLGIGPAIQKMRRHVDEILILDAAVPDAVLQLAGDTGTVVIRHMEKSGYGSAFSTCVAYARQHEFTAMVILNDDMLNDPDKVPGIVDPVISGKADLVIGSWLTEKGGPYPLRRRFGQTLRGLFLRTTPAVSSIDSRSSICALSKKAIIALAPVSLEQESEPEVITFLAAKGFTMLEVPIIAPEEVPVSRPRDPIAAVRGTAARGIERVFYARPLLLFGVTGVLFTLAGLYLNHRNFTLESLQRVLSIGSNLTSGVLLILGLLLIVCGLILNSIGFLRKKMQAE
jgi:glycosyltransferase involved in cell wall biosynthesis